MFGFKKLILNELKELRKEVNEIKKLSTPKKAPVKKEAPKKSVEKGKVTKEGIVYKKIEKKLRDPNDVTVKEFAKELHVKPVNICNRVNKAKYEGEAWASDYSRVYYILKNNKIEKVLTEYAQNKIISKYGYGYKLGGRKAAKKGKK